MASPTRRMTSSSRYVWSESFGQPLRIILRDLANERVSRPHTVLMKAGLLGRLQASGASG